MDFPSAQSNLCKYIATFCKRPDGRRGLRAEAYIDTGNKDTTKKAFDNLKDQKQQMAQVVGEELDWDRLDGKRASRISLYFPEEIQITDEDRWPEARAWLVQAMGKMRTAFDPIVKGL